MSCLINTEDLITAPEAASLCGLSRQRWSILNIDGRTPTPVFVHPRITLWNRKEVLRWKKSRQPYGETAGRNN